MVGTVLISSLPARAHLRMRNQTSPLLRPPKASSPSNLLRISSSQKTPPSFDPQSFRFALQPPLISPDAIVGSPEYVAEPGTNAKFPRELRVPGCSGSLVLLGTGYREKVFAIIGVKVYAAGFYAEPSIRERLDAWIGKPAAVILGDSSLFSSILQAPLEKSLNIMLVRDVDGKTFWNALDDVISPRIKNPTSVDESALLTFRNTFQSRDLKQGTLIFLTWLEPSKMLISISSDGFPSNVDAEIESANVNMALYDAFFGESPVSPTLKTSVGNGLAEIFS